MTVGELAVLDDRYTLNELVASGGMADVYRATDQVLHRQVAVKVLRDSTHGSQRDRFVDEARMLASLSHPGLVTLLDAGVQGDQPYLVMELVEGPTLAGEITAGALDPTRVARIGAELAAALDYAHRAGVVHRDVKPSNVLLCDDGRVLLADFGIARLVDATDHHTSPGEAIGSPAYLAPEQVTGEPLTPAADIYSLGLVLLECLTGARVYLGSPIEAAVARLSSSPEIPVTLEEDWRTLITRMTEREPQARPGAAEVAASLGPALPAAGEPEHTKVLDLATLTQASARLSAESHTTSERGPAVLADRRRRLGLLALGVLAAVVLAVVVVVVLTQSDPHRSAPATPLPSGVPSQLQQPLRDLHRAVDGTPR
jgi:serine/threonine protein kinase